MQKSRVMRQILGSVIAIVILAGIGYGGYNFYILDKKYEDVQIAFASSTAKFEQKIQELDDSLARKETENQILSEELEEIKEDNEDLESDKEELEKLTTIDPQLLQKYSKVFFLNENYSPAKLKKIPNEYLFDTKKPQEIHTEVMPYLEDLMEDAKDDDIDLRIISGYRSFDTQVSLKSNYNVIYGAGTANQFSADQGYSEHQLGTTIDLTTPTIGASFEAIDTTEAFTWLQKNAYKSGFVLSYPKGNAYYIYEPWHWRFVGEDLARYLFKNKKNFYDMDQRQIDVFRVRLFD